MENLYFVSFLNNEKIEIATALIKADSFDEAKDIAYAHPVAEYALVIPFDKIADDLEKGILFYEAFDCLYCLKTFKDIVEETNAYN